MTTILLCWYAFGWAGLGIYCNEFGKLTLADLVVNLAYGPVAFLAHCAGWLMVHGSSPVIWRRKP